MRRYLLPGAAAVAALAIMAGIAFVIYQAVTAPTKGTILQKHYSAAYFYWVPGSSSTSCSGSGSYRSCSSYYTPGHMQYIPPEWSFDLRDCSAGPKKCNVGWRDVDPGTFDQYRTGQYYGG